MDSSDSNLNSSTQDPNDSGVAAPPSLSSTTFKFGGDSKPRETDSSKNMTQTRPKRAILDSDSDDDSNSLKIKVASSPEKSPDKLVNGTQKVSPVRIKKDLFNSELSPTKNGTDPPKGSFEAALMGAKKPEQPEKRADKPQPVKKEELSPTKTQPESKMETPERPASDSEDDIPLSVRLKKTQKSQEPVKKAKRKLSDDEDDDYTPVKKEKRAKETKPHHKKDKHRHHHHKKDSKKREETTPGSPSKKKKGKQEEEEVWKWWEEEKHEGGIKWKTLEHNGPMFAPPYERLPSNIKLIFDGKPMKLEERAEEVATFYAKMLDHEFTTKKVFNDNFWKDWRKMMTTSEREHISDLKKCDFTQIKKYFDEKAEEKKNLPREEKKKITEAKQAEALPYQFAMVDGHKQKVGNVRIEPPGLFRGRGDHPKMGALKRRTMPEDVIINCSKGSKVPTPPEGHRWREIRHDNYVTWLASWTENIQGSIKYVMLNPGSKIKGEKDWEKFETARKLKDKIDHIRKKYTDEFKAKEMMVRQRATALYLIDKLALRAGNEKEEGETADTVGCCSLRCEHVELIESKFVDGVEQKYILRLDFLGKDSIRYENEVPVEKRVWKNIKIFMEKPKKGDDDLFDRLNTTMLNKYLQSIMAGLTAKVFRTYNASITLQEQLNQLTNPSDNLANKVLQYNRANRQVAILCNHQRAVPKTHEKSMENLEKKLADKRADVKAAKKEKKNAQGAAAKEKAKKKYDRLKEQLAKLEVTRTDKDENKTIALGTSKLNYLDPRISVAWCKKHNVPLEKVYSKTQREKFHWAIDMADESYVF